MSSDVLFKVDSSEDEENPVEDSDSCSKISDIFKKQYCQTYQESVSLKKSFIRMASASHDFKKFAIGLADEMQVYDVTPTGFSKYVGKNDFGKFDRNVTGVEFFKDDPNMLLASTIGGEIFMYDLRTFAKVHTFEDDSELVLKPFTCFDINANNRLICAGSEEMNHNVYMLFFDIRERKFSGGFFESHTEEVTDVKFHPTNPDLLATGSTDGLINIFDTKQESEDDALKYCLNTESSVSKIKWHHNDKLSCITNTNDLQLFDVNEQDLLKRWDRASIASAMKRKSVIDCNLVDCYNYGADEMMYLATSNYNKGECIRSLSFDDKSMQPLANFQGNKQIIRASLYKAQDDIFFTFGESGIVSVWKEGDSPASEMSKISLKEDSSLKKKLKNKNGNPY
ncbi:unnamed protein product [Diamesa tonsa]